MTISALSFWRRLCMVAAAVLGLVSTAAWAQSEPRLALLIGNAAYKSSPLANPVNDVRLMETVLRESGFTVMKAENAPIRDMRRLIREFGDRLKASGGVGLFYFAGHGVQVRGENFLVAIDSDIRNEDEVADDAVNAGVVLEKMESAGNRMNILILDACRNNPFATKSRSSAAGLATMNAPSGSIVAYATAPGAVASDGLSGNGLYTGHLARAMRQSGLAVEEVFKQVRAAVRKDSNNQQTPWESTALEGQFFFRPVVPAGAAVGAATLAPPTSTANRPTMTDGTALELALWDSVKNSAKPAELEAYLAQFPTGTFAGLARARLDALRAGPLVAAASAPQPADSKKATTTGPAVASVGAEGSRELGELIITDNLTGLRRSSRVSARLDGGTTQYSTGDGVAADGRQLQVLIGEVVLRTVSGQLWQFPLTVGQSGEAVVERVDAKMRGAGRVRWKVVPAAAGKLGVEADVYYPAFLTVSAPNEVTVSGNWSAIYPEGRTLAESFSTRIGATGRLKGEFRIR